MPTNRKRRSRFSEAPVYSPHVVKFLEAGEYSDDRDGVLEIMVMDTRQAWQALREDILERWVRQHPGTRPYGWWAYDAPRWRREDLPARCRNLGDVFLRQLAEPRKRLGGVGTPCYECLNYVPSFQSGVPCQWVTAFFENYYNGRSRDVHGKRIGTEYHEGNFAGRAIDPTDPPIYESQATYLQRHGLLSSSELAQIPPDAFTTPEYVLPEPAAVIQ
jgi:hypothetical protein